MRVLILCVGSRGDAEPFCALASKLLLDDTTSDAEEHHVIDFFVQPELQHLVPQPRNSISSSNSTINVHLWPFTQTDFYKAMAHPKHGKDHAHPRVRFVGLVSDMIADLVLPCAPKIAQVAKASQSQVIVTSALARHVAMAVGFAKDIPVALVHLQPLLPTDSFPHSGYDTDKCVEAILRLTGENGCR